jgi:hypothetical protein
LLSPALRLHTRNSVMAIVPVVHASSIIIISSVPQTALRSLTHASLKFASAKRLQEELLVLKSELRGLIDKDGGRAAIRRPDDGFHG